MVTGSMRRSAAAGSTRQIQNNRPRPTAVQSCRAPVGRDRIRLFALVAGSTSFSSCSSLACGACGGAMNSRILAGVIVAFVLVPALPCFAQFGQVTGIVTDTTGGVLPGATVSVTNTQTAAV